MARIVDTWQDLGRRRQLLAGVAAAAILLALGMVLLVGGDDPATVDGSSAATEAALRTERAVEPTPGTIVASEVPTVVDAAGPPGSGVMPLSASADGGGGDAATGMREGLALERLAAQEWEDVPAREGYEPPQVSAAVALAGRDVVRVARAYRECVRAGGDLRPCMSKLTNGVYAPNEPHQDGRGITLAKRASDGNVLFYTELRNGSICYALNSGNECDAWGVRDA